MKKRGKYFVNPAPYAMIVANPGRKKKRRGIIVLRRPTMKKNPTPRVMIGGPVRRSASKLHHKRGTFVYNPVKTKTRRHRKNALKIRHILVQNPARRKKRREKILAVLNPMKKHRRRGSRRRSRNPMTRRGGLRRRMSPRRRSRNPRRYHRMRNPMPAAVLEIFGPDTLAFAGGVVVSSVGTSMVMNYLLTPSTTTGTRPFSLPGVDYTSITAGSATPPAAFYSTNAYILAFYNLLIGSTAGYLLRKEAPRLSRGIIVGTVATTISNILKNTGFINATGGISLTPGTSRYLPGARANFRPRTGLLPGTNPIFTNPAQRFLTANNVPRPRGMGARVGPSTMTGLQGNSEGAFRGAN